VSDQVGPGRGHVQIVRGLFYWNDKGHTACSVRGLCATRNGLLVNTPSIPQGQPGDDIAAAVARLSLVMARAFLCAPPAAENSKALVLARAVQGNGRYSRARGDTTPPR